MMDEVRATFFLVVSLVFFLLIIGVLAVGAMMRPRRWSDRPRLIGQP